MKKTLSILLAGILMAASLAGCATGGSNAPGAGAAAGAPAGDTVVATLGDDVTVSLSMYRFFYGAWRSSMEQQAMMYNGYAQEDMEEFWDYEQDGVSMRDMLSEQAMSYAKQYALLYNAALEAGTQVDEERNAETDGYIETQLEEMDGDEEEFYKLFFQTPQEMKETYLVLNLADKYYDDVVGAITVSDEELEAEYEENIDQYQQVTVRHILISVDGEMDEEEREEARQLAQDLLERIQAGEAIGELAAEYSQDPGSKDNDGEYTFGKGMMVEPFENWSFSAQPGDQGLVESTFGYHVMEMVDYAGFEDVRDQVEESLTGQRVQAAFQEFEDLLASQDWVIDQEAVDTVQV